MDTSKDDSRQRKLRILAIRGPDVGFVAQSGAIVRFSEFPGASVPVGAEIQAGPCTRDIEDDGSEDISSLGYVPSWMLSDYGRSGRKYTCANNGGLPGKERQ